MRIFHEAISFEWDKGTLDKNWEKHGVTNQEAEEVFFLEPRFLFEDAGHSLSERRHLLWGVTARGRKLSVIFAVRNNRVRIISARDMSRKERNAYEEKVKGHTKI